MEMKTHIHAEDGRQELTITRSFEIPVELLFKAYTLPEIVEQWMGTKVEKLDSKAHGGYRFVTTDPKGNEHPFSGVIHDIIPDQKIIRTFQMENTPFEVQLEFLEFKAIDAGNSHLTMHIVYRSVEQRDQMLKLPFQWGLNMAHNRLEEFLKNQFAQ